MARFCTLGGCTLRPLSSKVIEKRTLRASEAEQACASISFCKGFAYTPASGAYPDEKDEAVEIRFFGTPIVCSWFGGLQNICLNLQTPEDRSLLVEAVCESKGRVLHHANTSEWLNKDRALMLAVVSKDASLLSHLDKDLRSDREVALAAIRQDEYAEIPAKLWNDTKFVATMVQQDGLMLRRASEQLQADRLTVLDAVRQNGDALRYASRAMCADREVVTTAVSSRVETFMYASEALRSDKAFVQELMKTKTVVLQYASDKLRSDPDFILPLVRRDERSLEYASDDLRADKEFITKIVMEQGDAIRHAWHTLWEDADLILLAVKADKKAIRHAGKAAWNNREFVLRMVRENWQNLQRASDDVREDREIAKVALSQTPEALQYVGEGLKEDPEIVYLCYHQDEDAAVRYARADVFTERDFCLALAGKKVPKEWSLAPSA